MGKIDGDGTAKLKPISAGKGQAGRGADGVEDCCIKVGRYLRGIIARGKGAKGFMLGEALQSVNENLCLRLEKALVPSCEGITWVGRVECERRNFLEKYRA